MIITDYKPGDEQHILGLFRVCFKRTMSPEYWKWRFIDNPSGMQMIKLIWDDHKLVGHYAVCPVHLIAEGKKTLSALSMTTMTHPEYGGRGIFTSLAGALYQECHERYGLSSVIGFPNQNSHYGFIKNLRWTDIAVIPSYTIPAGKITVSEQHVFTVTHDFTDAHAKAADALYQDFSCKTVRDVPYLEWRYVANPVNRYEVFTREKDGFSFFAVTKIFDSFTDAGKKEIDIIELFLPDDITVMQEFLSAVLQHYGNENIVRVNTWMSIADRRKIAMEKLGFIHAMPLTFFGGINLGNSQSVNFSEQNWYYSMGDSDIY